MFEHFRCDWAYAEPNFFERYPKIFFFKIFILVLSDRFLDGFSKFWFVIGEIYILIRVFWVIFKNCSMRMLSIGGNDFIACWAYAEPISSHAEHARKCLKVEYLGRIEYDFQKSCVSGPWDHRFRFLQKRQKKISCLCTFKSLKIRALENYVCLLRHTYTDS